MAFKFPQKKQYWTFRYSKLRAFCCTDGSIFLNPISSHLLSMLARLQKRLNELREQIHQPPPPPPPRHIHTRKENTSDGEPGLPSDILHARREERFRQLLTESERRKIAEQKEYPFKPTIFTQQYVPYEAPPKLYWDTQGRLIQQKPLHSTYKGNTQTLKKHISDSAIDKESRMRRGGNGELRKVRTLKHMDLKDFMNNEMSSPRRKPKTPKK